MKTSTAQRLHDKNLPGSVCSVCSVCSVYYIHCLLSDVYGRERLAACGADLEKLI